MEMPTPEIQLSPPSTQSSLTENGEEPTQQWTELTREKKKIFSRQLNKETFTETDALAVCNQKVLIVGISANSSEVMKNLIGNGTRFIYIYDETDVSENDIRSIYQLTQSDLTQRKDAAVKKHNTSVRILNKDKLNFDYLKTLGLNSITVAKVYPLPFLEILNKIANQLSIPFIVSFQMGLSYFVFSDFGLKYQHRPLDKYFSNETTEETIYSLTTYNENHMETFIILHSVFSCLTKYQQLPRLFNEEDSYNFFIIVEEMAMFYNHTLIFEKQTYLKFAKFSSLELPIVAEISGAMAACEVLKSVVQNFEPVNQVLFWDNLSFYPDLKEHTENDIPSFNKEIFAYEAMFGKQVMNEIANLKVLIIGCGAVGCEQVKNLYQMRACTGKQGKLYLVDNDSIEITNLPRQINFTEEDVNKNKAKQSKKWLERKDPSMNVIAYDILVNKQNENIFNDEFYDSIDLMVIAVDTVKAREYLADKAIKHNIFLVESGTKGFMAQSQCQVPYLSKRIEIAKEDNSKGSASCTVKSILKNETDSIIYSKTVFDQFTRRRENDGHLLTNSGIDNYFCLYYRMKDHHLFCDTLLKQFVVNIFNRLFDSEIKFHGDNSHTPFKFDDQVEDHKELVDSLFNHLKSIFTNYSIYEKYLQQKEAEQRDEEIQNQDQSKLKWLTEALPSFDKDDIDQGNIVYQLSKLKCKAFNVPYTLERYDAIGQIGNIVPAILESTSVASGFALFNLFNWLVHKEDINNLHSEINLLNIRAKKQQLEEYQNNLEKEGTDKKPFTLSPYNEDNEEDKRVDLFLSKEEEKRVEEKFYQFGFKDTCGQIKSPYMCFQSFSSFRIQDLNKFSLTLNQNTTLQEIVESININLQEKLISPASYIFCNEICIYDEGYKSLPLPPLIKRFALYLEMNLIGLANSLEQDIFSSSFNFQILDSKMNDFNKRVKGKEVASFKIKVTQKHV